MSEAISAWIFTRQETAELLNCLSDERLLFKPDGEKWQPLYYQFSCMIRTQYVYAKALHTGLMDFAYFGDSTLPTKHDSRTKAALQDEFSRVKTEWQNAIETGKSVDWPDGKTSVDGHIYKLIAHERLHHGQIISYFTLAGIELPPVFKANWAL